MFVDRKPTRPMRYKVKPESGGEPYYVTMERADEPTVEGTPLNAAVLNRLLEKPANAKVGQYLKVVSVDSEGYVSEVESVESTITQTTLWSGEANLNNTQVTQIVATVDFSKYDLFKLKIYYSGGYLTDTYIWGRYDPYYGVPANGSWYANGNIYEVFVQVYAMNGSLAAIGSVTNRKPDSATLSVRGGSVVLKEIVGIKLG